MKAWWQCEPLQAWLTSCQNTSLHFITLLITKLTFFLFCLFRMCSTEFPSASWQIYHLAFPGALWCTVPSSPVFVLESSDSAEIKREAFIVREEQMRPLPFHLPNRSRDKKKGSMRRISWGNDREVRRGRKRKGLRGLGACGGWKSARLQLQISLLFFVFWWSKGRFESEDGRILTGSTWFLLGKLHMFCHVLYCIFSRVHFIRNAPLITLFLLRSPWIWVPDARHRREARGKTCWKENELKPPQWKKYGLKACLRASLCVWIVNACSWNRIMSLIHTWACLLLWVSFATQDKTPGKTQTPLCPSRESLTGIKRLKRFLTQPDTQFRFGKKVKVLKIFSFCPALVRKLIQTFFPQILTSGWKHSATAASEKTAELRGKVWSTLIALTIIPESYSNILLTNVSAEIWSRQKKNWVKCRKCNMYTNTGTTWHEWHRKGSYLAWFNSTFLSIFIIYWVFFDS